MSARSMIGAPVSVGGGDNARSSSGTETGKKSEKQTEITYHRKIKEREIRTARALGL
jgi:hypothetical protein